MSKCFTGLLGAGAIPAMVAAVAMVAPVGAEASVSGSDRQAVPDRALAMCAAYFGPRHDLVEDRCNSLPEVPRRSPGNPDESASDLPLGDWPIHLTITVSQSGLTKGGSE